MGNWGSRFWEFREVERKRNQRGNESGLMWESMWIKERREGNSWGVNLKGEEE